MSDENNGATQSSAEDEFDQIFDEVVNEEGNVVEAATQEEAPAEAVEEVTVEEPDIWADAPDELKTQYQTLQHQNAKLEQANKSHAGRLGAMQRQLNQFQSPAADERPSAEMVADAMETPEKWAEFQDEYPDIHAAVESRIEQSHRQNQDQTQQLIDQAIQPLRAAEQHRTESQEMAALAAAHNDWETVIGTDDFKTWMAGQPDQIHTMLNGDTAHEVSTVLSFYKGAQPAPQNSNINDLKAQRQAQLQQSTGIQSKRGPGAVGVIPNDWDGAWEATADG